MEWVETTGRTVDEAKAIALDQLGVAEDDAEFEVLDEPRAGLFGRVRGEARVRARVRPTTPRAKAERRPRTQTGDAKPDAAESSNEVASATDEAPAPRRSGNGGTGGKGGNGRSTAQRGERREGNGRPAAKVSNQEGDSVVDAQQVGDEAARFVGGLVEAFGLEGTTSVVVEGDDIEVKVDGSDLGLLVGPRGSTLQAVQELARVAAQRRLGDHDTRLRVDVGGYRERRKEALGRFAQQVAGQVVADGTARSLEPMSSADRKIVHDVLSEFEGVTTSSAGEDPNRRVVISPANA